MLKDEFNEFRYDDDLPQKEELLKKRGKPKTNKADKFKRKIGQLEKCIKNKDKRITEIENRWIGIKKSIAGIGWLMLIFVIIIGMITIIMTTELLDGFKIIMSLVGTLVFIFAVSTFLMYLIFYIDDPTNEDKLSLAVILGISITILLGLIIALLSIVSYELT